MEIAAEGAFVGSFHMVSPTPRDSLAGGWGSFYSSSADVNIGKPHLRTFNGRQAEKFYETSILPLPPARSGKSAIPPAKESLTWGIGGTLPVGRFHGKPLPAAEFRLSCRKYIPYVSLLQPNTLCVAATRSLTCISMSCSWCARREKAPEEVIPRDDFGHKKHVFNDHGQDVGQIRSKEHMLEDVRKQPAVR